MRRMIGICLLTILLVACSQAGQSGQITATPTAIGTLLLPNDTPITPITVKRDPAWANFHFVTTYVRSTTRNFSLFGWSPDSQLLLYRDQRQLWLFDRRKNISRELDIESLVATWLPDSSGIIFVPFSDQDRLLHYTIATNQVAPRTRNMVPSDLEISALKTYNDKIIVASSNQIFTIDNFESMTLLLEQSISLNNYYSYVLWSPSGDKGVILDKKTKTINFVNTYDFIQLDSADQVSTVVWSPHEDELAISDLENQIQIIDVNGKTSQLLQVSNHPRVLQWNTNNLIYNGNNDGQSPYNAFLLRNGETESLQINEPLPDQSAVSEVVFSPDQKFVAYRALIATDSGTEDQLLIRAIVNDR